MADSSGVTTAPADPSAHGARKRLGIIVPSSPEFLSQHSNRCKLVSRYHIMTTH